MNFLQKMHSMNLSNGRGIVHTAVDAVERYGASMGFGVLSGAFPTWQYKGMGVDLMAGVALKSAAVTFDLVSNGRSSVAPHLNAIGDAGIQAHMHTWGLQLGSKLNKGAKKVVAGYIPAAVAGDSLSDYFDARQLANIARK